MFTEVDAISSDGSTMTQLVKDTTEARPSQLKLAIDESKRGLLAPTQFPVHGAPTKPIVPETVQ